LLCESALGVKPAEACQLSTKCAGACAGATHLGIYTHIFLCVQLMFLLAGSLLHRSLVNRKQAQSAAHLWLEAVARSMPQVGQARLLRCGLFHGQHVLRYALVVNRLELVKRPGSAVCPGRVRKQCGALAKRPANHVGLACCNGLAVAVRIFHATSCACQCMRLKEYACTLHCEHTPRR